MVTPVPPCEISILAHLAQAAPSPTYLTHIVEALGRSRNELRHAMKRAQTDMAEAQAKNEDVSVIASLTEQMVDVHACRSILRTFATEILASDADDRDFDVLFAPDPLAGLEELASLRESRLLPGFRGSREGKNYVDLSRIRGIFEEAHRDNRSITKAWVYENLPPGRRSSIPRCDIPLLEGTVFLGVPGKMVRLSTVEALAILDVTTGAGGCYPETDAESDADTEYDAEDESDAEDAGPLRAGSGSSVFEKFRRDVMLRKVASLGKTSKTTSTGMLKLSPQLLSIVRSYASSPGFPSGSFSQRPEGASIRYEVRLGGWDAAMRAGLVATVKSF